MSVEEQVAVGVAELLDTAGIATWSPTAPHAGPGPVVTVGDAPAAPDLAVTLTPYVLQDDPHLADALVGLQVRVRGTRNPRTAWEVSDRIRDALNGRAGFTLGTVPVVECHRQASAPIGRDENDRWEQADTYHLQVNAPSAERRF